MKLIKYLIVLFSILINLNLIKGITGSAVNGNSILDISGSVLWTLMIIIFLIIIFLLWKFWDKLFFKDIIKSESNQFSSVDSGGRSSSQDETRSVKNESGKNAFASSNSSYAQGFKP
ncbi:MAG: hypothetical protein ACOCUU_03400 [Nanoarchaeota archaeon]